MIFFEKPVCNQGSGMKNIQKVMMILILPQLTYSERNKSLFFDHLLSIRAEKSFWLE